uniref:Uncharacterized protein n=1 Tax=Cacopsylla melanoneura TaxID=428564 RepID=A0A8D9AJ81_9HEMI
MLTEYLWYMVFLNSFIEISTLCSSHNKHCSPEFLPNVPRIKNTFHPNFSLMFLSQQTLFTLIKCLPYLRIRQISPKFLPNAPLKHFSPKFLPNVPRITITFRPNFSLMFHSNTYHPNFSLMFLS